MLLNVNCINMKYTLPNNDYKCTQTRRFLTNPRKTFSDRKFEKYKLNSFGRSMKTLN